MATQDTVSLLARALPHVVPTEEHFGFAVHSGTRQRSFVWVWQERVEPRRPRVPNPDVVAVRVADLATKEELLAADPAVYFTEPHYDGYPAVLVRLDAIDAAELAEVLTDAWLCSAPASIAREFEAGRAP